MAGAISLRPALVKLLVGQPSVLLHEGRYCGCTIVLDTTRRLAIPNTLTGCVERVPF